jgi:hypothetical protein
MAGNLAMSGAKSSRDPFSDDRIIEFEDFNISARHTAATHEVHSKTAYEKQTVAFPTFGPLHHPAVWSPQSNVSSLSTVSLLTEEAFATPIQWRNVDLSSSSCHLRHPNLTNTVYLLSCLLPDLLLTNQLVFTPLLDHLHIHPCPIHLQLFKKLPVVPPPLEAYSKHAPIGTGRPRSKLLVVESDKNCTSAEHARASLAKNLFSYHAFISYILDKYNVLTTLYTCSNSTLLSLQRGMIEMLGVPELEWSQRLEQLDGQVDGACVLEARLEVFLLGVGRDETEEWVRTVMLAMEMEEKDRRIWAEVYGDAAEFLWRAVGGMYMWENADLRR